MKAAFDFEPLPLYDFGGHIGYKNLVGSVLEAIDIDSSSPIELTVCNPGSIVRRTEKFFVAYTMWESEDFPIAWKPCMRVPDAIIVPTEWCKKIFQRFCKQPIFVVRPPINSKLFAYTQRRYPEDKPFRWLYCNSLDSRKGLWFKLAPLWDQCFSSPKLELYIKTTQRDPKVRKIERVGNAIIDSRFIPEEELIEIYNSSHAFISTSIGEGFGYSLAEAMACGLPAVATGYSGMSEYFNKFVGFPIKHYPYTAEMAGWLGPSDAEDGSYTYQLPERDSTYKQMAAVMDDYPRAVKIAKRGADLIRTYFTMEKFQNELRKVYQKCLMLEK